MNGLINAIIVITLLLPAICFADNLSESCSDMQDRLNSFEKKFQDMERSMSRVEGIVSSNTVAMETFASVLGKRYTEPSRIELYVSQQQEILSKLPILQENMENLLEKIQAQINTQTKSINNIAEDLSIKLNDAINTTKERVQQHEEEFEVARDRMKGMESLMKNMETKVDDQTGTLKIMANLLTTKTEQPSHLLEIKNNQATLKSELQNNFATAKRELQNNFATVNSELNTLNNFAIIKSDLNSLKSSVGSIDSKTTVIKDVVENPKRYLESIVEGYSTANSLGTNRTNIMKTACSNGDASVVSALLDLGMHVNTRLDSDSYTCLHRAAINDQVNVGTVLLDRGADTDLRDSTYYGYTPVLLAVQNGRYDFTRTLVERGASIAAKTYSEHKTALNIANQNKNQELIKYLRSKHAPA